MAASPGLYQVNDGDATLVSRVLAGDEEAYGALMARYRDRFARYARHLLGDQGDTDDVLQETFVRGYRFLRQCEQPDQVGAWLFRILVNRCRTAYAGRRSRGHFVPIDREAEDTRATPESLTGWREEIDRALAQLPVEQREAFLLKYVEELSYEEMVEYTGTGVSALKMRVKRACERLRDLLGELNDVRSP